MDDPFQDNWGSPTDDERYHEDEDGSDEVAVALMLAIVGCCGLFLLLMRSFQ